MKIEFGTAGIREENLSIETIDKVINSICDVLEPGSRILIGRDTRESGLKLSKRAVQVAYSRGISVSYIDRPVAISLMSYEIKNSRNKYALGLYFSASHNPPQYNGIKIIDKNGLQIDRDFCKKIEGLANSKEYKEVSNTASYGHLNVMAEDLENRYIRDLGGQYYNTVKLVYNCGCGTGRTAIPKAIKNIRLVDATNTETLSERVDNKYINPENEEATALNDEEIVIATDPDCDRIAVCEKGRFINGHEMTALLLDYLIQTKGRSGTLYKSRVTSLLSEVIAKRNNIKIVNTDVGFRNIAKYSNNEDFIMGAEESCGYLLNSLVSDKCGISTAMEISKMIDFWYYRNTTLEKRLKELNDGYVDVEEYTSTSNISIEEAIEDFKKGFVLVSRINGTYKFIKEDKRGIIYVRKSGTERNKCKIYSKYLR